jgi:hypothetical protein
MGLKVTWTPDAAYQTVSSTLILCNSSRSIAEHNLKINNRALVQSAELFEAPFVTNLYHRDDRIEFSFEVERSQDFTGTNFPDAESAFIFAANHMGGSLPNFAVIGTGTLTALFSVPGKTLTFTGAIKQSIDLILWMGISITLSYKFLAQTVSSN